MMYNLMRLVSSGNGLLPGPLLHLRTDSRIGHVVEATEIRKLAGVHSFRYKAHNRRFSMSPAILGPGSTDEPDALLHGYFQHVTSGPYGGTLFQPGFVRLDTLIGYGGGSGASPTGGGAPIRHAERERGTASDRTLGYPYMVHGGPGRELWVVDLVNTLPFYEGLARQLQFSPSKKTTGTGKSESYDRTPVFDARVAEVLTSVPGVGAAFDDVKGEYGIEKTSTCRTRRSGLGRFS